VLFQLEQQVTLGKRDPTAGGLLLEVGHDRPLDNPQAAAKASDFVLRDHGKQSTRIVAECKR
jgi:hypothetical protein